SLAVFTDIWPSRHQIPDDPGHCAARHVLAISGENAICCPAAADAGRSKHLIAICGGTLMKPQPIFLALLVLASGLVAGKSLSKPRHSGQPQKEKSQAGAQDQRKSYPNLPSETPANFQPVTDSFDYIRRDVMIPMRDGVKLHT